MQRRTYDSSARRADAELRRQRVCEAARDLFFEHGYAQVTVGAIAARAGVSEALVYRLFNSKRGLVEAVLDLADGGEDQVNSPPVGPEPPPERSGPDVEEQIRRYAVDISGRRQRWRPYNDLLAAAARVEPDVAALEVELHRRQRCEATAVVAAWIAESGPLRAGLSEEEAGDVLWTLAGPDVFRMLTLDWGWSVPEFSAWLVHVLVRTLRP